MLSRFGLHFYPRKIYLFLEKLEKKETNGVTLARKVQKKRLEQQMFTISFLLSKKVFILSENEFDSLIPLIYFLVMDNYLIPDSRIIIFQFHFLLP